MWAWLKRRWPAIWQVIGGVSLQVKIVGLVLAMIALLGVGLAWQVRMAMGDLLASELRRQGAFVAESLVHRGSDLLTNGETVALSDLARSVVSENEDVRYALILDAQGRVLAQYPDGTAGQVGTNDVAGDQRYHAQTLQGTSGLVEDIAVPIGGGGGGTVRIGMSWRAMELSRDRVTRRVLVTTLVFSLLAMSIGTVLTLLFTRPVLALTEAIRRVASGDLSTRLTPWSGDEIGQAQASFNLMVERLARSRHEMEASHQRIQRRNRELSALYAISRAVAGPLKLEEVLRRSLQQAMDLMGTSSGWICLLGEDDFCQICVRSAKSEGIGLGLDFCEKCSRCREAAITKRPVVISPLPSGCPLLDTDCQAGHVVVPLVAKERAVGLLNLVSDSELLGSQDLGLLMNLGQQLGIAIENARLVEELQRKEAVRGQLLRKVITAQEEERVRIARELHDEAGQALTSVLVGLKVMEKADDLQAAQALISDLKEIVTQTIDAVHDLATELRPSVLDDLGLIPALARYVRSCPVRFGFEASFEATGARAERLPREIETTLYRVAQEALTNVARHARASRAGVLLQQRSDAVVLIVDDNGIGFDPDHVTNSAEERERLGLYGIEERASLVGGHLTIESEPGGGTTLSVEIPLEGTWQSSKGTASSEKASQFAS
jgi:signal transduction histidine kinase